MKFNNYNEINHYLVSEMYHQILIRMTPSLLPAVTTRHFVGGETHLFHSGIDRLDNIVLYDESLLYDMDAKDQYAKWYQRYRRIYKKGNIVVYHDLETDYFIVSPRVSKLTMILLSGFNRDKHHQITIEACRAIGNNFYSNLIDALYKIGETFIRDMAIANIEPFYSSNDSFKSVINTPIDTFGELILIYQTIASINPLCHLNDDEVSMTKQLWRGERFLSQKALSVVYNTLISQRYFSAFHDGGFLLDPIIKFDILPSDENNIDNNVGCLATKYTTPGRTKSHVYALFYIWSNLFERCNEKPYVVEFNLIDELINLTVNNLMSIEATTLELLSNENVLNEYIDTYIKYLKNENKSLIKERAIYRMASYDVDDMPDLYSISTIIGNISKKGKWTI